MLHRVKFKLTLIITLFSSPISSIVLAESPLSPPIISNIYKLRFGNIYASGEDEFEREGIDRLKGRGEKGLDLLYKLDDPQISDYIYVKKGERLKLNYDDEISRNTIIKLMGHGSTLILNKINNRRETLEFNALVVDSGEGVLDFSNGISQKTLIDDLIIKEGACLKIEGLYPGYDDHFLVKKTSQHLADALSKIRFKNYPEKRVGVRDYDKDYWEIGYGAGFKPLPTPEPSTYGAILTVGAFGFVAWRRRVRRARGAVSLRKWH